MKALFITSVLCAVMSSLAIIALSAMTIVPESGAEHWRTVLTLVMGSFFVGWLGLAFWLRYRRHTVSLPQGAVRLLVVVGEVYALGVCLCVLG